MRFGHDIFPVESSNRASSDEGKAWVGLAQLSSGSALNNGGLVSWT